MTERGFKYLLPAIAMLAFFSSCKKDDVTTTPDDYTGTASVTQGAASTTTTDLFPQGQRVAGLGSIVATDNTVWTMPAEVNFTDASFPTAPDLFNPYGTQYSTAADALAAFDPSDIVEVDAGGEVITGYIFADNYFELYVNGVAVGKDAVPFTDFNSHLVKFRVARPFTIAMKLVDWEENLGLGSEANGGSDFHPGDGGLVAVFKDEGNAIVATTGSEWKAQTFYTAPIRDLTCPSESGTTRSSAACNSDDSSDGSSYYALHWTVPDTWMAESYDDSAWPAATTFTEATVGVDNKPSYTNFTDVFDDASDDAEFIWSTNLVLDNEVIVRHTVN